MMLGSLYSAYLRKLIQVNDESKTEMEHAMLKCELRAWKEGVKDASGASFNGDYYYIEKINSGEMIERPMCCGEFLDWESKADLATTKGKA